MKNALDSYLGGNKDAEDMGTAAPYEGDFSLAGEDDMGMPEGGDLLSEVQGMLATASPDQLEEIKGILSAPKGEEKGGMELEIEMKPEGGKGPMSKGMDKGPMGGKPKF